MSYVVGDEGCEIDLSKLISYTMSFQPLQLLFEDIMKRLKQSETANERQDNELTLLRMEMDELRRRDADREAQLQNILSRAPGAHRQQPQKPEGATVETVETEAEDSKLEQAPAEWLPPYEDRGQSDNLQPLWDEIEYLKRMVGNFCEPMNNASIEQLYHARRKVSTTQQSPLSGTDGDFVTKEKQKGGDTEGVAVGEVILQRANEELQLDGISPKEEDPTGESMQPDNRAEDVVPDQLGQQGESSLAQPSGRVTRPVSGRRMSQGRSSISGVSFTRGMSPEDSNNPESLFVRVRQDEESIGRLNRVVAEILSELKGLQKDVDLMRTVGPGDGLDAVQSARLEGVEEELEELKGRLSALEGGGMPYLGDTTDDVARTTPHEGTESSFRNSGVAEGDTAPEAAVEARPTGIVTGSGGDVVPSSSTQNRPANTEVRDLRARLNNLEAAFRRMNDKLLKITPTDSQPKAKETSPIPPQSVGEPASGVEKELAGSKEFESGVDKGDLEQVWGAIRKLQGEAKGLGRLCATLERKKQDKGAAQESSPETGGGVSDEGQMKADKELGSKQGQESGDGSPVLADLKGDEEVKERVKDLSKRLNQLQNRLVSVEGNVLNLDDRKADYSGLQRLADDVRGLRQLLEMESSKGGSEGAAATAQKQEEQIQNVQKDLVEQMQMLQAVRDGTSGELDTLRKYVEHIDRCKADAQLVANKAERDYVENALERLMREVEQVLNTTNASLIDTLDKSLNILRDMLDGKAGKEDLVNMQRILSEEHDGGGVADVLMGFRGFRCLGCNRPVDKMRPRSLGSRLQPFVNRLPQNLPPDQIMGHVQDVPLIYNTNKDVKPSSA